MMRRKFNLQVLPAVLTCLLAVSSVQVGVAQQADHDAIRPVRRSGGWLKRHEG